MKFLVLLSLCVIYIKMEMGHTFWKSVVDICIFIILYFYCIIWE